MRRVSRLMLCIGAAACIAAPLAAFSQVFPSKPVRLVVPFPPGGTVDTVARSMGPKYSETWGQPIVVENRAGAGGHIGADAVAKAAPDGYSLLLTTHGQAISPSLYRKLPYDPLKDLAPVSQVTASYTVLAANAQLGAATVKDLIAFAKAHPGVINFGSSGVGSASHLPGEMFRSMAAVDIVHVPYKGDAPLGTALLAGEVQIAFIALAAAQPHLKAGKVKLLAVTSPQRARALPDVPTMSESGVPNYEFTGWLGIFAPSGTPREVLARVSSETARVVRLPDIVARLPGWGYEPVGSSPEEFAKKYTSNVAMYEKVVRDARIPPVD